MPEDIITQRRRLALVSVLLGQFMLILDASVVNVALPAMQADLGLAPSELTWVTNAYLIAFGGLLLLFGRLGDLYGRARVFMFGLGLFTAASLACGLAPGAWVLVGARFLQGVGAGAASSVILAIITTEFPEERERARAMSGYMFVSVAGGSMGLFVGGLLTQILSWHWIFLINLPVGAFGMWLAHRSLREQVARSTDRGLDVAGSVLVTAAVMAAIYGLVEAAQQPWSSTVVRASLGLAVGLLAVFCFVEMLVRQPVMPLRVLRIRSLMITSVVRGFMVMGLYGVFFLASLDMSGTLGFGPLRVGLAFLPQTAVVALMSLGTTARLVRRFGPQRVLVAGLAIGSLGLGVMANLAVDAPYFPVRMFAHMLLGLGFGMAFLPLLMLGMSDVPAKDAGLGSAIVNLSQQLSGAVSVAILVTFATGRTHALEASGTPVAEAVVLGYRFAYAITIAGLLVGLTLAATLLRRRPPVGVAGGPRVAMPE